MVMHVIAIIRIMTIWFDFITLQQTITCSHASAATNFEHHIRWLQESFRCLPETDSARINEIKANCIRIINTLQQLSIN
jgi:hypothetical protein